MELSRFFYRCSRLGDASAHEFSLHLAQMNYFVVVVAFANIFLLSSCEVRKFVAAYCRLRLFTKLNICVILPLATIVLYFIVKDYTYDSPDIDLVLIS